MVVCFFRVRRAVRRHYEGKLAKAQLAKAQLAKAPSAPESSTPEWSTPAVRTVARFLTCRQRILNLCGCRRRSQPRRSACGTPGWRRRWTSMRPRWRQACPRCSRAAPRTSKSQCTRRSRRWRRPRLKPVCLDRRYVATLPGNSFLCWPQAVTCLFLTLCCVGAGVSRRRGGATAQC